MIIKKVLNGAPGVNFINNLVKNIESSLHVFVSNQMRVEILGSPNVKPWTSRRKVFFFFFARVSNEAKTILTKNTDMFLPLIYALVNLECFLLLKYIKIVSNQFIHLWHQTIKIKCWKDSFFQKVCKDVSSIILIKILRLNIKFTEKVYQKIKNIDSKN